MSERKRFQRSLRRFQTANKTNPKASDWGRISTDAQTAATLLERSERQIPREAWTDVFEEVARELTRGTYGLEDFKLHVTDFITSVDNSMKETRASLPEEERNGAAMKEFEDVCLGKLQRRLDPVRDRYTKVKS
ncbi:unnamed protein product [Sphacelaria rigidula]